MQELAPKPQQVLRGHAATVNAVAIAPDGRTLLTSSEDGQAMLWALGKNQPLGQLGEGHYGAVNAVIFARDGQSCFTGSDDAQIKQWDLATRQEINLLWRHQSPVTSLDVSADGRFLLSGSTDKTALLWDIATGCPVQVFRGIALLPVMLFSVRKTGKSLQLAKQPRSAVGIRKACRWPLPACRKLLTTLLKSLFS
ncbi:MAG: hypothetical protein H6555_00880 [Lewinellaceae bacterium]|nr:hypothetical protein [Lewinellaceae bacterium]